MHLAVCGRRCARFFENARTTGTTETGRISEWVEDRRTQEGRFSTVSATGYPVGTLNCVGAGGWRVLRHLLFPFDFGVLCDEPGIAGRVVNDLDLDAGQTACVRVSALWDHGDRSVLDRPIQLTRSWPIPPHWTP
jgi:hypothetical protein